MTKVAAASLNYAAGIHASNARHEWVPRQTAASGTYAWPYNANVVWQDTTSNATYCSANTVLAAS